MPAVEVRVHPLSTGVVKGPPGYFARPSGALAGPRALVSTLTTPRSKWLDLPVPVFLVEHPEHGAFMIDTGLAPACVDGGTRADVGRIASIGLSVDVRREQLAGAQVAALGHDPAQIELVVMTHLHFDHLGGSSQFPAAEFVGDERDVDDPPAMLKGTHAHHFAPVRAWRRIRPGGVDDPHDLFGDGSVRLVHTPGHTPGHLSVLLRATGGRDVLLTADAAYTRRTLEQRLVPLICPDVPTYLRSLDALAAWVAQHPDAIVLCGHDPWDWDAAAAQLAA